MAGIDIGERQVEVGSSSLRLLEAGPDDGPPILFVHGWPETADAWSEVMSRAAADGHRALAVDLPGVGGSAGDPTDGTTRAIADLLAELIGRLERPTPAGVTVVGHDLGGMVAYAVLRRHSELVDRAVIMDVVVPGVAPWQAVLANPYVWHFAFHSIPRLPEALVQGRQRVYFDFFYDALGPPGGAGVSENARQRYVEGYRSDAALQAGFSWYRGLGRDAEDNVADATGPDGSVITVDTPLLYLRGEHESGDLADYLAGFAAVGLTDVRGEIVPAAGHFAAEDNPQAVWQLISEFVG